MRRFDYFLYDSYDPRDLRCAGDDPRRALHSGADALLSAVTDAAPGACRRAELEARFPPAQLALLIRLGLLREERGAVLLDAPVLLGEDLALLERDTAARAARMADRLAARRDALHAAVAPLRNGFSPEVNLYHLLCGGVFDGSFFDCLCARGLVSTARLHPSGLDYLIIVYERTPALDRFSRRLLCSCNRFADGERALQSFGDADGTRCDPFRFDCRMRAGTVPAATEAARLWAQLGAPREVLLRETQRLADCGRCGAPSLRLLTLFGYARGGSLAVPVYRTADLPAMRALEALAEDCVLAEMSAALRDPEAFAGLRCVRHGVPRAEIANELYHILFGRLNEALVARGLVAAPPFRPGEGRYLQAVRLP